MATTIKHKQIKNRDLTGASFHSELRFYDETKSYNVNDVIFYQGRLYRATQDIPAATEGDLQYSPVNHDAWVDVTYELFFKQRDVDITNANDFFNIQLSNPNQNFLRHCYILKYADPQSNIQQPIANFDSNETLWDYDPEWVVLDGKLHLKTSTLYNMAKMNNGNIDIYYRRIDSSDYEDLESIMIITSD